MRHVFPADAQRLQQYPMIENRTGPQTIEFLTKRVVALGAVQVGQFLVDCETYMSVPQLDFMFEFQLLYQLVRDYWHRWPLLGRLKIPFVI
ncbi:Mediator of RNA polymerase II transcription subunit 20 [Trachymyrmex septentrionalis]|uniref:Mediator of RNA polymerase II transcription subunit 20 n=1 Tax=Trachymyrmex septentrionalis TaxID=34720 RepID=A0A195FD82_9HYME|nr:Mediator of RNA polymerase II transcription subunit 20 [Trachymyrmex septentrionalis]